jgi:hypothetical protein
VKRRAATKDFNDSVVAVFEDILQSLTVLGSLEEDYRASMTEVLKSNRLRQTDFLERHQTIVEGISDHVSKTVSALNKKL